MKLLYVAVLLTLLCFPACIILLFTGVTNVLIVNVDATNTENASVNCTFMSNPGYSCAIVYDEDPSYTNLVNNDTSVTEDEEATIHLSQPLQTSTMYYFIVSAESSSRCERVRGRFQTGGCINSGVFILTPGNIVRVLGNIIGCLDSLYGM